MTVEGTLMVETPKGRVVIFLSSTKESCTTRVLIITANTFGVGRPLTTRGTASGDDVLPKTDRLES